MSANTLDLGRQTFGKPEHKGKVPTKAEALALLDEWVANDRLKLHMRQVAGLMAAWAKDKLGLSADQVHLWEITGLLHDADWDKWPEQHGKIIIGWLEERNFDPDLMHGIASHGPRHFGVVPVSDLDKMIYAFDELSGFTHAVSLMRPTGYEGMEVSSVKKKLKDKGFAAQVDRADITEAAVLAGIELDELIRFVIERQASIT